jgi:hypothetical protein
MLQAPRRIRESITFLQRLVTLFRTHGHQTAKGSGLAGARVYQPPRRRRRNQVSHAKAQPVSRWSKVFASWSQSAQTLWSQRRHFEMAVYKLGANDAMLRPLSHASCQNIVMRPSPSLNKMEARKKVVVIRSFLTGSKAQTRSGSVPRPPKGSGRCTSAKQASIFLPELPQTPSKDGGTKDIRLFFRKNQDHSLMGYVDVSYLSNL